MITVAESEREGSLTLCELQKDVLLLHYRQREALEKLGG